MKKILIIPDRNDFENTFALQKEYNLGFEYNDFYIPKILDDEIELKNTIDYYKNLSSKPEYCTLHGAFFDVTVFSDDAKIYEVSDYRVEQSLKVASELGVKGVVFHTNYTPNFKKAS